MADITIYYGCTPIPLHDGKGHSDDQKVSIKQEGKDFILTIDGQSEKITADTGTVSVFIADTKGVTGPDGKRFYVLKYDNGGQGAGEVCRMWRSDALPPQARAIQLTPNPTLVATAAAAQTVRNITLRMPELRAEQGVTYAQGSISVVHNAAMQRYEITLAGFQKTDGHSKFPATLSGTVHLPQTSAKPRTLGDLLTHLHFRIATEPYALIVDGAHATDWMQPVATPPAGPPPSPPPPAVPLKNSLGSAEAVTAYIKKQWPQVYAARLQALDDNFAPLAQMLIVGHTIMLKQLLPLAAQHPLTRNARTLEDLSRALGLGMNIDAPAAYTDALTRRAFTAASGEAVYRFRRQLPDKIAKAADPLEEAFQPMQTVYAAALQAFVDVCIEQWPDAIRAPIRSLSSPTTQLAAIGAKLNLPPDNVTPMTFYTAAQKFGREKVAEELAAQRPPVPVPPALVQTPRRELFPEARTDRRDTAAATTIGPKDLYTKLLDHDATLNDLTVYRSSDEKTGQFTFMIVSPFRYSPEHRTQERADWQKRLSTLDRILRDVTGGKKIAGRLTIQLTGVPPDEKDSSVAAVRTLFAQFHGQVEIVVELAVAPRPKTSDVAPTTDAPAEDAAALAQRAADALNGSAKLSVERGFKNRAFSATVKDGQLQIAVMVNAVMTKDPRHRRNEQFWKEFTQAIAHVLKNTLDDGRLASDIHFVATGVPSNLQQLFQNYVTTKLGPFTTGKVVTEYTPADPAAAPNSGTTPAPSGPIAVKQPPAPKPGTVAALIDTWDEALGGINLPNGAVIRAVPQNDDDKQFHRVRLQMRMDGVGSLLTTPTMADVVLSKMAQDIAGALRKDLADHQQIFRANVSEIKIELAGASPDNARRLQNALQSTLGSMDGDRPSIDGSKLTVIANETIPKPLARRVPREFSLLKGPALAADLFSEVFKPIDPDGHFKIRYNETTRTIELGCNTTMGPKHISHILQLLSTRLETLWNFAEPRYAFTENITITWTLDAAVAAERIPQIARDIRDILFRSGNAFVRHTADTIVVIQHKNREAIRLSSSSAALAAEDVAVKPATAPAQFQPASTASLDNRQIIVEGLDSWKIRNNVVELKTLVPSPAQALVNDEYVFIILPVESAKSTIEKIRGSMSDENDQSASGSFLYYSPVVREDKDSQSESVRSLPATLLGSTDKIIIVFLPRGAALTPKSLDELIGRSDGYKALERAIAPLMQPTKPEKRKSR